MVHFWCVLKTYHGGGCVGDFASGSDEDPEPLHVQAAPCTRRTVFFPHRGGWSRSDGGVVGPPASSKSWRAVLLSSNEDRGVVLFCKTSRKDRRWQSSSRGTPLTDGGGRVLVALRRRDPRNAKGMGLKVRDSFCMCAQEVGRSVLCGDCGGPPLRVGRLLTFRVRPSAAPQTQNHARVDKTRRRLLTH